jgi:hypothetical protein
MIKKKKKESESINILYRKIVHEKKKKIKQVLTISRIF